MTDMTRPQAAELWNALRSHFLNFSNALAEIIEKRAWEPLGYSSFPEAWTATMGDVTLAAEFRPHVVYAYFMAGASDEEVAEGVKGVGRESAAALRRQRDHGVPASHASTRARRKPDSTMVREHERKKPSAADTVHIKLGVLKLRRYQRIARKRGESVESIALAAIEARFEELR
jgi:hypothetical protein